MLVSSAWWSFCSHCLVITWLKILEHRLELIPSKDLIIFFFKKEVCLCVFVWVCVHECRCLRRLDMSQPLKLEMEALVSHPMWVLGTPPRSSAGALCGPNHWAISPTSRAYIAFVCDISVWFKWLYFIWLPTVLYNRLYIIRLVTQLGSHTPIMTWPKFYI